MSDETHIISFHVCIELPQSHRLLSPAKLNSLTEVSRYIVEARLHSISGAYTANIIKAAMNDTSMRGDTRLYSRTDWRLVSMEKYHDTIVDALNGCLAWSGIGGNTEEYAYIWCEQFLAPVSFDREYLRAMRGANSNGLKQP